MISAGQYQSSGLNTAEQDDWVRIRVSDTGRGIPLDRQGALFQPFNRLGAEASGIEGTGIGLKVTRDLVQMMGGRIGFESAEGQGATFWVDLPLAPVSSLTAPAALTVGDGADQKQAPAHRRLLVIDPRLEVVFRPADCDGQVCPVSVWPVFHP